MKLRSLLATLALALMVPAFAEASNTTTQDLGTLDADGTDFSRAFVRFFGLGTPTGDFVDYYTFNVSNPGTAAGGVVSFDFGTVDLSLNSVTLKDAGGSSVSGNTSTSDFSFSNLMTGMTYTLAVSGSLTSGKWLDVGGAYYEGSIRSIASAGPEPSALALALAGLAGVAAMTRRRRSS